MSALHSLSCDEENSKVIASSSHVLMSLVTIASDGMGESGSAQQNIIRALNNLALQETNKNV